ncbi:MAG: hypothetical protein ACI8UR_000437 [Natronomonas sp.]|jgi:hypothetical protein
MSPVVGKAMEATLVVLYLGLITTALYGGAVTEYRTAAGNEVAERTVASAAGDIEAALPPNVTTADVRVEVDIPATIAGSAYRIQASTERLVLRHPNPAIEARVPLTLPERVGNVSGAWTSDDPATVRVTTTESGLEVRLE